MATLEENKTGQVFVLSRGAFPVGGVRVHGTRLPGRWFFDNKIPVSMAIVSRYSLHYLELVPFSPGSGWCNLPPFQWVAYGCIEPDVGHFLAMKFTARMLYNR